VAGLYPQDLIERIKDSVDIVDIISSMLPLKKSGANYTGLCPFHQEKTPSFSVSPSKQIFHCFGCGEGGNVITFLVKYEGLPFKETLENLAQRAGIELPKTGGHPAENLSILYEITKETARFYRDRLTDESDSSLVREYVKERGISADIEKRFGLGFAPDSWDSTQKHLKGKGYSQNDIKKSALSKPSSRDEIDVFRNRLIFPIIDEKNRVIGFGGRAIKDEEKSPKYINSPESPIYRKGRILYGLNLAGKIIREKREVIVVEGYMDLIAIVQAGIGNVVATAGTAFTEHQCRLMKRYSTNITMLFDGDDAGRNAAEKATRIAMKQAVRPKIAMLPAGKDPDDLIKESGVDALKSLMADAKPFISYLIEITSSRFDISTPEGKSDAVKSLITDLSQVTDPVERAGAVQVLAGKLEIPAGRIESRLPPIKGERFNYAGKGKKERADNPNERNIIRIIIDHPSLVAQRIGDIKEDYFQSKRYLNLFILLKKELESGATESSEIAHRLEETEFNEAFRKIMMENRSYDEEYIDKSMDDFIQNGKKVERRLMIEEMKKSAKNAEREEYLKHQKDFNELG